MRAALDRLQADAASQWQIYRLKRLLGRSINSSKKALCHPLKVKTSIDQNLRISRVPFVQMGKFLTLR